MNYYPRVSIVLCTYNGEKYLEEQIESLLAQTYPIHEIIIQDDCSTDRTWAIITKYKNKFPNLIKGFQNENNMFWNQNFYSAIKKASGEYIALCDQDDYWMPEKIERQISDLLETKKKMHFCSHFIWKESEIIPQYLSNASILELFFHPQCFGHLLLFDASFIKYIEIGVQADMTHDNFLGIVGTYFEDIYYSRDVLVKWRRHQTNATGGNGIETRYTISSKRKVILAFRALLYKDKSKVIEKACTKYLSVFSYLRESKPSLAGRIPYSLVYWLKKQSLFSYLRATFYILRKGDILFNNGLTGIKRLYAKMTFVFIWWYDHHEDM